MLKRPRDADEKADTKADFMMDVDDIDNGGGGGPDFMVDLHDVGGDSGGGGGGGGGGAKRARRDADRDDAEKDDDHDDAEEAEDDQHDDPEEGGDDGQGREEVKAADSHTVIPLVLKPSQDLLDAINSICKLTGLLPDLNAIIAVFAGVHVQNIMITEQRSQADGLAQTGPNTLVTTVHGTKYADLLEIDTSTGMPKEDIYRGLISFSFICVCSNCQAHGQALAKLARDGKICHA